MSSAVMASTRLAGEMAASCNPSEGSEPLYQSATLYGLAEDIAGWTSYMADVIDKAENLLKGVRPLGHPRAARQDLVGALLDAATEPILPREAQSTGFIPQCCSPLLPREQPVWLS